MEILCYNREKIISEKQVHETERSNVERILLEGKINGDS